jgi:hypothetical protein
VEKPAERWWGDQDTCAVCGGSSRGDRQYIPEEVWCCDCCAPILYRASDQVPHDPPPKHGRLSVVKAKELLKEAESAGYEPGSLMANPEFREVHAVFQRLWTAAVGTTGYDKKEWQRMDNELVKLARKARM